MDKEEFEFRIEKLKRTLVTLRYKIFDVVNGLVPIEELQKAIQEWEEKRQELNNKDIGIIIHIPQITIQNFKITDDPKRNMGQKNLSKNPDSSPPNSDLN